MILCDLPYGLIGDTRVPFKPLWKQYKRIIKENGAIVLFGSQPFTTDLINSNRKWFKYELIWNKMCGSPSFNLAKKAPLKSHENILIFGKKNTKYNPLFQMKDAKNFRRVENKASLEHFYRGKIYPRSVITISSQKGELNNAVRLHPSQKPVLLCRWLIETYTNKNDLILDNCIGSGTTVVACIRSKRNFIGIELSKKYFDIAQERIEIEKIKYGA